MATIDAARRSFATRVALFYGALFVFYGMHTPFLPVWMNWRGLTPGEISVVIAAPLFLRVLVSPVVAMSADRHASHRRYLVMLALLSVAFVLALAASLTFPFILLFAVVLMLCNSTVMPLIETIAVSGVRHRGLDYGQMRLWGSLTFVAANFVGGFAIFEFGGGTGIWLIAFGCAVTALAALVLPADKRIEEKTAPTLPLWRSSALSDLLAEREFRVFLIASGLTMAAHAAFFTFGILLWQQQGISSAWSGMLWAIGVFAEVLLFSISGRAVASIGAAKLIAIGAVASIARWSVMAFEPPLALLIPLQLLHGATYGATHIGAIHFIHERIPLSKQGTAQSLYATMAAGLALGGATLVAGWIYGFAGSSAYLGMVSISTVAFIAAMWLIRQTSPITISRGVLSPSNPKVEASAVE
jgi:MFS transporter, PPP family, 3-phenylpropionic acid transporter